MTPLPTLSAIPVIPQVVDTVAGVFTRLSSNQAYTPPAPVPRADKPRIKGKGRPMPHKAKPYDRPAANENTGAHRKASTSTAAAAATGSGSLHKVSNPVRGRHVSLRVPSAASSRASSSSFPAWTTAVGGSQVVLEDIEDEEEASFNHGDSRPFEHHDGDVTLKTEPEDDAPTTPTPAAATPDTTVVTAATPTPASTRISGPATQAAVTHSTTPQPAEDTRSDLYIRIPAHLHRPPIPPMAHLRLDGEPVPAEYVRYHLSPHLPKLLRVCALYRPVTYAPSPAPAPTPAPAVPTTFVNTHGLAHSMAFGVPELVGGHDADGAIGRYVAGCEPDLLLAVRCPTGAGPKYVLKPVKHIVYASRCRLFPSLPAKPLSMHFVHPNHRADSAADDRDCGYDAVEGGAEVDGEGVFPRPPTAMSARSDSDGEGEGDEERADDSDASDASFTTVSSTSAASEVASLDTGDYVHLPIVAIDLPSPDTFEMVHNQLHLPSSRWEPALLGLTVHQATNPTTAHAALDTVTAHELNRRLMRTHGVWQNMYALGVDDERMWTQLDRAYGMLLTAMRRRASRRAPVSPPTSGQ